MYRNPVALFDRSRLTIVACFITMFMVGVAISLLGPSLPGLAGRTGISLAQAGIFFTCFSGGSVLATLVVARFMDRPVRHALVIGGTLVLGLSQWLVAGSSSLVWVGFAIALAGLAMSTAGTGPNALIVEIYRERAGQALNALHFCLGIGAFIGPLLIGVVARLGGDYTTVYRISGTVAFLLALLWLVVRPPQPLRAAAGHTISLRAALLPLALPFLFIALYTGVEQAFSGWLFTYAQRVTAADATQASLLTSLFWLAVLLGRLAAARGVYHRLGNLGVLALGVTLGVVGLMLALASSRLAPLLGIGVGLAGFGFGPLFPTTLVLSGQRAPSIAGMASTLAVAAGSTGAMVMPYASGALMASIGMVGGMAALFVPLAAMLVCVWTLRRGTPIRA